MPTVKQEGCAQQGEHTQVAKPPSGRCPEPAPPQLAKPIHPAAKGLYSTARAWRLSETFVRGQERGNGFKPKLDRIRLRKKVILQ